jgi:hypothetical protein
MQAFISKRIDYRRRRQSLRTSASVPLPGRTSSQVGVLSLTTTLPFTNTSGKRGAKPRFVQLCITEVPVAEAPFAQERLDGLASPRFGPSVH